MSKNTAYTLGIVSGLLIGIASGLFFIYYCTELLHITHNKPLSDYISWSPHICFILPLIVGIGFGIEAGVILESNDSVLLTIIILFRLIFKNILFALLQGLIVFGIAIIICIIVVHTFELIIVLMIIFLITAPITYWIIII